MPRFFISPEEAAADRITLTGEAARHILSSLRMRVGERLTLCDGQGTDLLTELCEAGRQQVTVQVLSRTPSTAE
ncbi:MAG: 16S rRNA (uracil(1498)-N(3))-methyltransferase, partial [Clostridia bacterium]|nr:16S rRNA (uracil(1498)-N(3))-methyltransferase [Clostridia bacterium]